MPRTPTKIPQEVKEQMCRDYRRGTSVRQIATIYGIGRNKAYEIVQSGCEIKMGRPKTKDSLMCENMKQDYLNGLGIKKLAKKYGYEVATVYRCLKEVGINVKVHQNKTKQDDIIKDLEIGELSQSEIARKNNVSRQYVLQVKKKMNRCECAVCGKIFYRQIVQPISVCKKCRDKSLQSFAQWSEEMEKKMEEKKDEIVAL